MNISFGIKKLFSLFLWTISVLVLLMVFFVSYISFASAQDVVPRDGLVAEYLFDGNINDTSGKSYN